jgi:uncharacterized protein (DUF1697 family)
MHRQVLLLRGVNLGPNRRVPMPELRSLFAAAGYGEVCTYVQSGNVVLWDRSDAEPGELAREAERLIAERFGFEVPVIARSRDQLAAVVASNPLGDIAEDPKRYQVSFLSAELDGDVTQRVRDLVAPGEALVVDGRELYIWHPHGVARSKLWNFVAGRGLGVNATARNWTTVTTLLEMTGE